MEHRFAAATGLASLGPLGPRWPADLCTFSFPFGLGPFSWNPGPLDEHGSRKAEPQLKRAQKSLIRVWGKERQDLPAP